MSTKEMTCIVCPIGCRMAVTLDDDGKVTNVEGNTCPRGAAYAIDEFTAPKRMLTTTVLTNIDGRRALVPVKTKQPIPKGLLFEAMAVINAVTLTQPALLGDTIIADLLGTGIDIVLTDDAQ